MPDDARYEQLAKTNRERLATVQRDAVREEEAKKADAVRTNMARLRELRLAKEAREVQTEIARGNQPIKARPKKRFR